MASSSDMFSYRVEDSGTLLGIFHARRQKDLLETLARERGCVNLETALAEGKLEGLTIRRLSKLDKDEMRNCLYNSA